MADIWAKIEGSLIDVVYGSNFIEVTGSNFAVTEELSRKIFRGEEVSAEVELGSPEYEQAKTALIGLDRPSSFEDALKYAINHILNNEPITEDFPKEAHLRLCAGQVLGQDAGEPAIYRTWEIAARHGADSKKRSIFIRASAVSRYMSDLVDDLREDMIAAEKEPIDPLDMASRYCHRFVCIHPFGDGNGRRCRILLNIILFKYEGHVGAFGGTENERQEYLDIARHGNKIFHDEDMEVAEGDKKGHHQLAEFIRRNRVR
ncbi:Fic-domain-containing protein [Hypoxylon crocopeplum]|nr:Fic-domain-containing protein [Hypoxylon crocopeplum]